MAFFDLLRQRKYVGIAKTCLGLRKHAKERKNAKIFAKFALSGRFRNKYSGIAKTRERTKECENFRDVRAFRTISQLINDR
jgi:hypothetical protein